MHPHCAQALLLTLLVWIPWTAGGATDAPAPPAEPPVVRTAPPAPAFKLLDLDDQEVKRADFAGQPLLVSFWASWDQPSRQQLTVLSELQKKHTPQGLRVLGISLDTEDRAKLRAFVQEHELPFPVLRFDLQVVKDFGGIDAIPTTFLIDRNHNIIERYVGFTERDVIEVDLKAVLEVK